MKPEEIKRLIENASWKHGPKEYSLALHQLLEVIEKQNEALVALIKSGSENSDVRFDAINDAWDCITKSTPYAKLKGESDVR